jgi:hypothetical protein
VGHTRSCRRRDLHHSRNCKRRQQHQYVVSTWICTEFLPFLTHFRPYAFLELSVRVLGLIGNYDDQSASILVPRIQQSSERHSVDSEGNCTVYQSALWRGFCLVAEQCGTRRQLPCTASCCRRSSAGTNASRSCSSCSGAGAGFYGKRSSFRQPRRRAAYSRNSRAGTRDPASYPRLDGPDSLQKV